MTVEHLKDIRGRLDEYAKNNVAIKARIQKKLEHCRRLLYNCLQKVHHDHESAIIKSELDWIDELIVGYNKDSEFLIKEDLLKINTIYNRYK
jgi:hypothetical protein